MQNRIKPNKAPDSGTEASRTTAYYQQQCGSLNCIVTVEQDLDGEPVFTVRIRGRILADKAGRRVNLRVKLEDLTKGPSEITAVYAKPIEDYSPGPKPFEYICDLGRLNNIETEITNWLSVARIKAAMIAFARRGTRRLLLKGSVFCDETGGEFANCSCMFDYDNCEYGYLDAVENVERSRALAVTLAFSLSAADGRMYKSEVEKIKDWARNHIGPSPRLAAPQGKRRCRRTQIQLEWALYRTTRFFKKGYKINTAALAAQLAQIAPAAQRYDIIEMCLSVAASKGFISAGQIDLLKKLAVWLEIEPTRFRNMVERLAPANIHQVKDMELIFGLDAQMTKEQTREKLNNEYRKWNARVTNTDPAVQNQAEQMLNLIAQTRAMYVE